MVGISYVHPENNFSFFFSLFLTVGAFRGVIDVIRLCKIIISFQIGYKHRPKSKTIGEEWSAFFPDSHVSKLELKISRVFIFSAELHN